MKNRNKNPFNAQKSAFSLNTRDAADFARFSNPTPSQSDFKTNIGPSPMMGDRNLGNTNTTQEERITDFPKHLFIPSYAQSVDLRNLAVITPASSFDLIDFVAPLNGITRFYGYGLYNDALLFNNVEFLITVDGARALPFHGNPNQNYKLVLGVAPDLSNSSIVNCSIQLNPGQRLIARAVNDAAVDVIMGVRFVGYLDSTSTRTDARQGG